MNVSKQILIISFIIALLFSIVIIAFFSFAPPLSFLSYLGYVDTVTLANPDHLDDPLTSHIVGELVRNGTLISVKDVWSFQSGFYQTIITFLIAINALIAAVSVFYIKSTSEEKAEETTVKYIGSLGFEYVLNNKIQEIAVQKLKELQGDFESTIEELNLDGALVHEIKERLDWLGGENKEIKVQIKIISERVALLDMDDREGKDLILVER